MRKFSLLAAAIMLSLLLSGMAHAGTVENGGGVAETELTKDQQAILDLLTIGVNDTEGGYRDRKIDMPGRKKFFTAEGWKQYQKFVVARKARIKALHELSSPANFDVKTRKMSQAAGGLAAFTAHGTFLYVTGCIFSKSEGFQIDVIFSPSVSRDAIEIKKWRVRLDTPDKMPKAKKPEIVRPDGSAR